MKQWNIQCWAAGCTVLLSKKFEDKLNLKSQWHSSLEVLKKTFFRIFSLIFPQFLWERCIPVAISDEKPLINYINQLCTYLYSFLLVWISFIFSYLFIYLFINSTDSMLTASFTHSTFASQRLRLSDVTDKAVRLNKCCLSVPSLLSHSVQ